MIYDNQEYIRSINQKSKEAFKIISVSDAKKRNLAILKTAKFIEKNKLAILDANKIDLENAREKKVSDAFLDRLLLNDKRIQDIINGLKLIAKMDDPLGVEISRWKRPNGLDISRVSVPLGVIGIIYESRPNVTIDAGSLCIKSGNSVILRGGSDSIHSSVILAKCLQDGLKEAGLPSEAVQVIENTDREIVTAMLRSTGEIDVIIPRGGKSLVEKVQTEARVPVFAHLEGICHLFVDKDADFDKAIKIIINSKMRRTGICGALETLLIDKRIGDKFAPIIIDKLIEEGCHIKGDSDIKKLVNSIELATDIDWQTEYLDAILSVKLVDGIKGAINHINKYSSNHTDSIITENKVTAETFLSNVDSAIVMHNASTQFADGGEFGMGAEIGISTGRIHARGPVGAAQLTSFKYMVRGNDQVRD